MEKRIFLILFLALLILSVNLLQAKSAAEKQEVRVDNAVYEKLAQQDNAKVIVRLYDEPKKGIRTAASKETAISSLSAFGKKDFKLVYKAHSINGFTAEISTSALEELKKNPAIKFVKIEPELELFLQDSVPMINATLALPKQISAINITGDGQTVCVIDTGINYTHADLGGCLGPTSSGCRVVGGYAFYNPFDNSNVTNVMDDNGHGTHVAGIVGANGSIMGVAPGVNFVALKACGPTSACGTQAVIDSVNWCVGNASRYNISVISMSLGGGSYTSYCDDEDSDMTDAIDSAIARNITVVVATGNIGTINEVSWPACIRNSTAVGATDKNDAPSYKRNNITIVLAPGENINSTRWDPDSCLSGCTCSGNYMICSGTSMATPHASGAVALLKQYKKLEKNTNLTTIQIKDVLNRTGKRIADSATGFNFSRLNVFAALVSIDETAPTLNISQPLNTTYTSNISLALNFTASDNLNLSDCWYSIDSAANISLTNCANTTFNATEGEHKINIYANDSAGNINHTNVTFNINLGFYSISACKNITSAGTYTLNTSINNSANLACINITASDVAIDCVDFSKWIDGTDVSISFGVAASGSQTAKLTNITIKNCNVTDWFYGIYYNFVENSTIVNVTSLTSLTFGLFINSSSFNRISNVTAGDTSDSGIFLSSGANYNTLTNITAINNIYSGIYMLYQADHNQVSKAAFINNTWGFVSAYSINNTVYNATYSNNSGTDINATDTNLDISDTTILNYSFTNTTVTIRNTSAAAINFPNLTVTNGTNFSADVILRNNYVFVNSSSVPGLNKSAKISFYGLSFNNPRILRDGAVCPSRICTKLSYAAGNGTLIFNVTGFSNYSAEDYCGNGNCDSGESCSSCSADCGSCTSPPSSGGGGGGGGGAVGTTYLEGALREGREVNRVLQKYDKIKFTLRENEHNLTTSSVTQNEAAFELNSSSLKFALHAGESRKFNLTDEKFYDLLVRLNNIANFKANLSMMAILEAIPAEKPAIENITNITKPLENVTRTGQGAGAVKPSPLWQNKAFLTTLSILIISLFATLCLIHKLLKRQKTI